MIDHSKHRLPDSLLVVCHPGANGGIGSHTLSALRSLGHIFPHLAVATPNELSTSAWLNLQLISTNTGCRIELVKDANHGHELALIIFNCDEISRYSEFLASVVPEHTQPILCPAWELDTLPSRWTYLTELFPTVFTFSKFTRATFRKAGFSHVEEVRVSSPLAMTRSPTLPPLGSHLVDSLPPYFFHSVDTRSFFLRKGTDIVLSAWELMAREGQVPNLILKIAGTSEKLDLAISKARLAGAAVTVCKGWIPEVEFRDLLVGAHGYIAPHRAEGIGLPIVEAILHDVPVITTDYSGSQQFSRPFANHVAFEMVDIGQGEYPFSEGLSWAQPSASVLSEMVAQHCQSPGARPSDYEEEFSKLQLEFEWYSIAETWLDAICRVLDR